MHLGRGARSFLLLQLLGWGSYGLATFLTFLPTVDADRWWDLFAFKAMARPAAGIAVSSLLALAYSRLDAGRASGQRIAGAAAIGSLAGGLAWHLLSQVLIHPARPPVAWPAIGPGILEYVFVMLAWSAAFFGVRAWRRSRERERAALEAEARATDAQLRMLTAQLNPHFLFNALSSLRGLVRRDPERAERTVTRLAAFLRHALADPAGREVPLAEELEVVDAYLDVERARLGEALEITTEVGPGAAELRIPSLLLYPLVENAIKHARREPDGTARVAIRAWREDGRLLVEVANPGKLGGERPAGTGVGLRNVRERLAHTHPGRHALALEEGEGWVRARLEIAPRVVLPHPPTYPQA